MSDFKAKMHQKRFRLRLRPRPRCGSLHLHRLLFTPWAAFCGRPSSLSFFAGNSWTSRHCQRVVGWRHCLQPVHCPCAIVGSEACDRPVLRVLQQHRNNLRKFGGGGSSKTDHDVKKVCMYTKCYKMSGVASYWARGHVPPGVREIFSLYVIARSLLSSGVRPSVCPSRSCIVYIQTAEDIVKHLSRPGSPMILVFLIPSADTQFQGNPFGCS